MVEKYSDDEFEALLGKYDYSFKRGDIVKGVVCAYESDGAIVDIGSNKTHKRKILFQSARTRSYKSWSN